MFGIKNFLVGFILILLPTLIATRLAKGAVDIQTLTEFEYHGKQIYVYADESNDETFDCRKWKFYYLPVMQADQRFQSDWISVFDNEVRVKFILGSNSVEQIARQSISRKYTDEQRKACLPFWDVSPLMIESLTAYIVKSNGVLAMDVFPNSIIHPHSFAITFRFECKDGEAAQNIKSQLLDGYLEIEVMFYFDGFSIANKNFFITRINQFKPLGRKTVVDDGSLYTKYIHPNQVNTFIRKYLFNFENSLNTEDTNVSISTLSYDIDQRIRTIFQKSVIKSTEIQWNHENYLHFWQPNEFNVERVNKEINQIFSINEKTTDVKNFDNRLFKINEVALNRLVNIGSIILRPFLESLKISLDLKTSSILITEQKIVNDLKTQSIGCEFENDKLTLKSVKVVNINDLLHILQLTIINQQLTVEKSRGVIIQNIDNSQLTNININDALTDQNNNTHGSILSFYQSINIFEWNCSCAT